MSETLQSPPKRQLRVRLDTLRARRSSGMFGPAEIAAVAGSAFILILVVVAYLYFLVPARARRATLEMQRAQLQTELRSSQDFLTRGQTTDATVHAITQSLEAFETTGLAEANPGRMGLYDTLNNIIRANGLRNTSGPTYTPLDALGAKTTTGQRAANTKWQSIYPGIEISVTVEGQYQNLRRFVRDIEASKQFIIINTVELERATESNSPISDTTSGSARPSLVSLRVEMATYFQRAPVAAAPAGD
ncbi:MAG TPA: GspMb/PilO family protein [Pyrinomonadaceae bacterium]|nr:GspMb/PilO family protein [Pyrinomonadaceae bacterium]